MLFSHLTDEELVAHALGDTSVYEAIVERFEAPLLRYIRRRGRLTKEEAEDLLQEVFLKAYRNLRGFDPQWSLQGWLYRIARNETIDHFRRTQARPQMIEIEAGDLDNLWHSALAELADGLDGKFLQEKVRAIFGRLPEAYREILVLRFVEDLDYAAISDALKKPLGTVSTLVKRAKEKLKIEAQKEGLEKFLS